MGRSKEQQRPQKEREQMPMRTDDEGPRPEAVPQMHSTKNPEEETEEETHEMKPDTNDQETLDELVTWYSQRFIPQMVNGSNIPRDRMYSNLAVLQDAVYAYRHWKGHNPATIDTVLLRPDPPPPGDGRLSQLEPKLPPPAKYHMFEDPGGGPIEPSYQIDIDARHSVIHQPEEKKPRRAMCGNCGTKYELTDDPEENHHRAMRHKLECSKGNAMYTEPQRAALVDDFQNQPMQVEFRRREAAALASGADPDLLRITGVSILGPDPLPEHFVSLGRLTELRIEDPELYPFTVEDLAAAMTKPPARWWQFWRWFE